MTLDITSHGNKAYNQGSDARLLGLSSLANPYTSAFLRRKWKQGWDSVNNEWGADVNGKWQIRPLPKIRKPSGFWLPLVKETEVL